MTADEFRATLKALGLRQNWLARRLGVLPGTVNRWAQDEVAVPRYAESYLKALSLLGCEGQGAFDDVLR